MRTNLINQIEYHGNGAKCTLRFANGQLFHMSVSEINDKIKNDRFSLGRFFKKSKSEPDYQEKRLEEIVYEFNRISLNQMPKVMQESLTALLSGNLLLAIQVLDDNFFDEIDLDQKMHELVKGVCRSYKGQLLEMKKEFSEAEENYLRAISLSNTCRNNLLLGLFYLRQSEYGNAEEYLQYAINLAESPEEKLPAVQGVEMIKHLLNDEEIDASCRFEVQAITVKESSNQQQQQPSQTYAEPTPASRPQAEPSYQATSDESDFDKAAAFRAKAESAEDHFRYEQAIHDMDAAINLLKPYMHQSQESMILFLEYGHYLGLLWVMYGDDVEARRIFNKAYKMALQFENSKDVRHLALLANCRQGVGQTYVMDERHLKAQAEFEQAINVQEKLVDIDKKYRNDLALTYHCMGEAFMHRDKPKVADRYFRKAAELYRDLMEGNRRRYEPHYGRSLGLIALMYDEVGESSRKIVRTAEKALRALAPYHNDESIRQLIGDLEDVMDDYGYQVKYDRGPSTARTAGVMAAAAATAYGLSQIDDEDDYDDDDEDAFEELEEELEDLGDNLEELGDEVEELGDMFDELGDLFD